MKRLRTDYEEFEASSSENRLLLREEEFILEVTELLCEILRKEGISKVELARRLGRTKGFVTQILSGGRNLTLRTVADVVDALGYKIEARASKHGKLVTASYSIEGHDAKICDINKWRSQIQHQWTAPSIRISSPEHVAAETPDSRVAV